MAPKKKEKEAQQSEDVETRTLQGILIADWLGSGFGPLEDETPRLLLPLCGVPLVEVFLHQLNAAGCEEIFVLTHRYAEEYEKHIAAFKRSVHTQAKVKVFAMGGLSAGDGLRELVEKRVICDDFVLMYGSSVVNYDFAALVQEHLRGRSRDKDLILTKLLVPAGEGTFAPWDRLQVVYTGKTHELLQCTPSNEKLAIPALALKDRFKEQKDFSLQMRFNLVDAQVAICAPEVLEKLTENFDVQDAGQSFTRVVLDAKFEDELSSQSILVVDASGSEQTVVHRVDDARGLFAASVAVLRSLKPKKDGTRSLSHIFPDVCAKQVADRAGGGCLGPVPEGVEAKESFFAPGVTAAKGTKVERSIIFEGVSLGEDAEVENSILGPRCSLAAQSSVSRSLLGQGVAVAEEDTILGARLGAAEAAIAAAAEGAEGAAADDAGAAEEDAAAERARSEMQAIQATALIGADVQPLWDEILQLRAAAAAEGEDEDAAAGDSFTREVSALLQGAERRLLNTGDLDMDGLQVELSGLRMGEHKDCIQMVEVLVPMLMGKIAAAAEAKQQVLPLVKTWMPVVAKFKVKNSIAEGLCVVRGVERACRECDALGARWFAMIICTMIDVEALDDAAVSKWFEEAKATVEQNRTFIEDADVKRCVEYASQEDDDDDDDDED